MWNPFRKTEHRSGGGYSDVISQAIYENALGTRSADSGALAAVEAACGFVSRAFMAAMVEPEGIITPDWLALQGRQLVKAGESMSVITMRAGRIQLVPAAFWNFENDAGDPDNEDSWMCRVTTYGPSSTRSRMVGREQLIFLKWGSSPGTRYRGRSATSWASLSSKTAANTERAIADEVEGSPIAQIMALPKNPTPEKEGKILKSLTSANGGVVLVESTMTWPGSKGEAPRRDWQAARLGPNPPEALAALKKQAYMETLGSFGLSPALFDDSDGTSKREALRQAHLGVIRPLARLLEHELSERLHVGVRLKFDGYGLDLVSRAQVVEKLTRAGVAMSTALQVVGFDNE